MTNIIAISGKQYSGKYTLSKILVEKLSEYKRVGIGDAIKIEYGKQKGLTFEEIEKDKHLYRKDLIDLGDWGRAQDKMYWLKNLAGMKKIIVPDMRVVDEAEFFKSVGAILIRVNSTLENRQKRGVVVEGNDSTEIALDNYNDWDFIVENNSTYEDLVNQADIIIKKLNLK